MELLELNNNHKKIINGLYNISGAILPFMYLGVGIILIGFLIACAIKYPVTFMVLFIVITILLTVFVIWWDVKNNKK